MKPLHDRVPLGHQQFTLWDGDYEFVYGVVLYTVIPRQLQHRGNFCAISYSAHVNLDSSAAAVVRGRSFLNSLECLCSQLYPYLSVCFLHFYNIPLPAVPNISHPTCTSKARYLAHVRQA